MVMEGTCRKTEASRTRRFGRLLAFSAFEKPLIVTHSDQRVDGFRLVIFADKFAGRDIADFLR